MNFAIIDSNNVVINIATADQEFGEGQGWIRSDIAQVGDTYENEIGRAHV